MNELGHLRTDDPSLRDKIALQKELSANFVMVEDSLRAMAMRVSLFLSLALKRPVRKRAGQCRNAGHNHECEKG